MSTTLLRSIDHTRLLAADQLDPDRRAVLGQYMTPSSIADFMASLFKKWPAEVDLLDPGAGVGSLTDAFAANFLVKAPSKSKLNISTYEIEPLLIRYLKEHLIKLEAQGNAAGRQVVSRVCKADFIAEAAFDAGFGERRYTHVILNPPYKKIGANSDHRKLVRIAGVEVVNLYTAFLALSVALTKEEGEIVAIIPRSFCNGTYFRPFREWLLKRVALTHIHVFQSRKKAFADDKILQENVIVRFVRGAKQQGVTVSMANDTTFSDYLEKQVPFQEIVRPHDREKFIHIPTVEYDGTGKLFSSSLADLGLSVATGPVVDFRLRDYWLAEPTDEFAPLLYAHHFGGGQFHWPREHKKPNALRITSETRKWLMPRGCYAITKRFSSKEERRRLVSYVIDPNKLQPEFYGFENHLNVIHQNKHGIAPDVAHGISLFLNSTIVDTYFRSFSGHTQVNATDLRTMRFPDMKTLVVFGKWARKQRALPQEKIDSFVESYAN